MGQPSHGFEIAHPTEGERNVGQSKDRPSDIVAMSHDRPRVTPKCLDCYNDCYNRQSSSHELHMGLT